MKNEIAERRILEILSLKPLSQPDIQRYLQLSPSELTKAISSLVLKESIVEDRGIFSITQTGKTSLEVKIYN